MRRVALFAIGLLIALAVPFLQGMGGQDRPSAEVLRCESNQGCNTTTIHERPVDCNEWYVGMGRDALDCRWTSAGIDDVTMVTDVGNYITSPLSDIPVETERHDHGLSHPWDLEFLPDGSMLVTEDTWSDDGYLTWIHNGQTERLTTIETVNLNAAGLMGLEIHPEYPDEPYVYVYYTAEAVDGRGSQPDDIYHLNATLARYRFEDGAITGRTVIRDDIPQTKYEAGGGLEFGPDGYLYLQTGAGAAERYAPNQEDDLRGKILRFRPDGSVPASNPFNNSVYAMGFKNSQGMSWHPETGQLYATMHGKNRYDEVNAVDKGESYGFRAYICDDRNPQYSKDYSIVNNTPPAWCTKNWTIAPSQSAFVTDPDHPWYGDLFVASLRGRHIHRFAVDDGDVTESQIFYRTESSEQFREVEFWNGTMYALTDDVGEGDRGFLIELHPG